MWDTPNADRYGANLKTSEKSRLQFWSFIVDRIQTDWSPRLEKICCVIYIYLCIYKYLCIHTCIFIYKCICTHIYLSVYIIQIFACIDIPTMSHTNTRTYTYIHACYISCVHVHVYFFTCIIIYIFKSVQVNECMYIYDQLSMYAFIFECTFMFRHELWK